MRFIQCSGRVAVAVELKFWKWSGVYDLGGNVGGY